MPISHPREQQIVEQALIERYHFSCEALHPIPFTHLNHGDAYTILHQQEPRGRNRRVVSYYRQYVHRSLSCYVRMTQTGLVWISNRKLACDEIQAIFDGLRQLVNSVHIAHAALADVVERIFEARAEPVAVAVIPPVPSVSDVTLATDSKLSDRDAAADAEDSGDQGGDDFASEGDKTETNTTDEDNERSHSSSSSDDDKENAAPVVAPNQVRVVVSTTAEASDVDTVDASQAAVMRSREPRKSITAAAAPNPVTAVAPALTNGSERSFSAPAGELIAAVATTSSIDTATDLDLDSKLQTQQQAALAAGTADGVAMLDGDQHEEHSELETLQGTV